MTATTVGGGISISPPEQILQPGQSVSIEISLSVTLERLGMLHISQVIHYLVQIINLDIVLLLGIKHCLNFDINSLVFSFLVTVKHAYSNYFRL